MRCIMGSPPDIYATNTIESSAETQRLTPRLWPASNAYVSSKPAARNSSAVRRRGLTDEQKFRLAMADNAPAAAADWNVEQPTGNINAGVNLRRSSTEYGASGHLLRAGAPVPRFAAGRREHARQTRQAPADTATAPKVRPCVLTYGLTGAATKPRSLPAPHFTTHVAFRPQNRPRTVFGKAADLLGERVPGALA